MAIYSIQYSCDYNLKVPKVFYKRISFFMRFNLIHASKNQFVAKPNIHNCWTLKQFEEAFFLAQRVQSQLCEITLN